MYVKRLLALLALTFVASGGLAAEVFPSKDGFDRYGGYLAYKGKATGRFHLEMIDGRHFLVTPDGHGFLSIGVTHTEALARPEQSRHDHFREGLGGDWGKANAELLSHFRDWGYNSLGYGSHQSTRKLLPHFGHCQSTGRVMAYMGKRVDFPDVFSDAWKRRARNTIERMVREFGDEPNLIGLFWQDVPSWDLKEAKRAVGKTWVDAIRELPEDAPGKIRYKRFLRENGANASDEDFLVLMAREVYSHIGPLTRELAPHTLIFGERYLGRALPWRVIQEALPWIDVVSVQPGGSEFPKKTFDRLHEETGKPIIICDHSTSFNTAEHSNVGWLTLPDVASVGRSHARYLDEGFSTPYLIGYSRCQYIDRFISAKNSLKQGLLQVDGRPYAELVDWVRKNNWRTHERFLGTPGGRK